MAKKDIARLARDALASIVAGGRQQAARSRCDFRDQMDLDLRDLSEFRHCPARGELRRYPGEDYPQLASLNGCVQYLKGRLEKGWPRTRDPAKGQRWAAALTWVNAARRARWVSSRRDVSPGGGLHVKAGKRSACRTHRIRRS